MESRNESTGVCEKLFKSVTGSNSSHRKSGSPKVTDSSNLQNARKSGKPHISVPLKYQTYHSKKKEQSTSVFLEIEGGHDEVKKPAFPPLKEGKVVKVRPNIVIEGHDHHHQPEKMSQQKSDNHERYAEYISQVRDKIRSKLSFNYDHGEYVKMSAPARSATRKDSFNERVANYIQRSRKNMRTTSNVGDITTT